MNFILKEAESESAKKMMCVYEIQKVNNDLKKGISMIKIRLLLTSTNKSQIIFL